MNFCVDSLLWTKHGSITSHPRRRRGVESGIRIGRRKERERRKEECSGGERDKRDREIESRGLREKEGRIKEMGKEGAGEKGCGCFLKCGRDKK